ncbi:hypothetical protein AHF37_03538 [Paragonimus kellicotti]|nr:hypothetical protein AHF37_03538 [Paragonimus kellicotti]
MDHTNFRGELLFLIVKLLEDESCSDAASCLRHFIDKKQVLTPRINVHGHAFVNTVENYERVHGPVEPFMLSKLLKTLFRLVKDNLLHTTQIDSLFGLSNYLQRIPSPTNGNRRLASYYSRDKHSVSGCYLYNLHRHIGPSYHSLAHRNAVYCLQYDQRGEFVFTGSDDYTIKIWSLNLSKQTPCTLRHTLRGHVAAIIELAVSFDNHLLASVDSNCCLVIWCLRTGQPVVSVRGSRVNRVISGMTFLSTPVDSCTSSDAGVMSRESTVIEDFTERRGWLAITSFGGFLHMIPYRHQIHHEFLLSDGAHSNRWTCCSLTLLPTVRFITGVEGANNVFWPSVVCMDESVNSVAFSHCGLKLASGSSDGGSCWLWRFQAGKWRSMVLAFRKRVKCRPCLLAWSKSDRYLIASMKNGSVYIYFGESGRLASVIEGHEGAVHALSPSPLDDDLLATGGVDGRFQVWNIRLHRAFVSGDAIGPDLSVSRGLQEPLLCHYRYPPCQFDPDQGIVWQQFEPDDHLPIWQNSLTNRRLQQREQSSTTASQSAFSFGARPVTQTARDSAPHLSQRSVHHQPQGGIQRVNSVGPFKFQRITACRAAPPSEGVGFLVVTKSGLLSVFRPLETDEQSFSGDSHEAGSLPQPNLDSEVYNVNEQFFHWELDTAEWKEVPVPVDNVEAVATVAHVSVVLGSPPASQSVAGLSGARYDRSGRNSRPNPDNLAISVFRREPPNELSSMVNGIVGEQDVTRVFTNGYRPPPGVCFEIIHASSQVPFHRLPPPYLTNLRGVPFPIEQQRQVPGREHFHRPVDLRPSVTVDEEHGAVCTSRSVAYEVARTRSCFFDSLLDRNAEAELSTDEGSTYRLFTTMLGLMSQTESSIPLGNNTACPSSNVVTSVTESVSIISPTLEDIDDLDDNEDASEESEWSEHIDVDIGWWHRQRRRRHRRQASQEITNTDSISTAIGVTRQDPRLGATAVSSRSNPRTVGSISPGSCRSRSSIRQRRLLSKRLRERRLAEARTERGRRKQVLRRSQRFQRRSTNPTDSLAVVCQKRSSKKQLMIQPDMELSTAGNPTTSASNISISVAEDDLISEQRERLKRRLLRNVDYALHTSNRVPLTTCPDDGYQGPDCEGQVYPNIYTQSSSSLPTRTWPGPHFDWLSTYHPVPTPYVPQLGDRVVYISRGHQDYVKQTWPNGEIPIATGKACNTDTSSSSGVFLCDLRRLHMSDNRSSTGFPWMDWPQIPVRNSQNPVCVHAPQSRDACLSCCGRLGSPVHYHLRKQAYVCGSILDISYGILRISREAQSSSKRRRYGAIRRWRKPSSRFTKRLSSQELPTLAVVPTGMNLNNDTFVRLVRLRIQLDAHQSYEHLGSPTTSPSPITTIVDGQLRCIEVIYHDVDGVLDFVILRHLFDAALRRYWAPELDILSGQLDNGFVLIPPLQIRFLYGTPTTSDGFATPEWLRSFDLVTENNRFLSCLDKIMQLPVSEHFNQPVDLMTYPDYVFVNPYPVDLNLVAARLSTGFYRQQAAVSADLLQMLNNTVRYNKPNSTIVQNASLVHQLCIRCLQDSGLTADSVPSLYEQLRRDSNPAVSSSHYEQPVTSPNELTVTAPSNRHLTRRQPVRQSYAEYSTESSSGETVSDSQHRPSSRLRSQNLPRGLSVPCSSTVSKFNCSLSNSVRNAMTLNANRRSAFFREPIEFRHYPDYSSVVSCPMDLSTVRKRLDNTLSGASRMRLALRSGSKDTYRCMHECLADLRTIVSNSKLYNMDPGTAVFDDTLWLEDWITHTFLPRLLEILSRSSNSSPFHHLKSDVGDQVFTADEEIDTRSRQYNHSHRKNDSRRTRRMRQSNLACRKLALRKLRSVSTRRRSQAGKGTSGQ